MNTLIIDTSNNKEVKICLEIDGEEFCVLEKKDMWRSQVVLPLIEQLLQKHKLSLQDLSEIKVNRGPGSFTGLRVGMAIANMLSHLLHIPLNGEKLEEFVDIAYE